MKIETTTQPRSEIEADMEIVCVVEKNLGHPWAEEDKKLLELSGFEGGQDETCLMPQSRRIYVGADSLHHDDIRSAYAAAIRALRKTKAEHVKTGLYLGKCSAQNIKAMAEGMILGDYEFDAYKTEKAKHPIKKVTIACEDFNGKSIDCEKAKAYVDAAVTVALATNYTRSIVNMPPDDMTPEILGLKAVSLAEENGLECIVLDEKGLEAENMEAFLAVSRASHHPPRLVHLAYKPENAKFKVALVGKGLTYDSGGLSLKPAEYMVTMKSDKSGACAVLGIMKAVSELKLPIEVHGIIGATENMIGGNAYKPDDILKAKNGTTIEIRNTDAEGRLVLADCLCYAQEKVAPDYLLDFATLTGACVVALGEYTTGLMGHDRGLKHSFSKAATNAGELTGTLPFNRYLKKLLKSDVADVCNISSSRYGGAITAALFLDHFIEKEYKHKWLHLDIAGPAFVEKPWGYNPAGASGAGVRMTVKWFEQIVKQANKEDKSSSH
ncbi:leucyl aminopeptidase [Hydrogenimonas cancrithermarum]|uniref:Probable cytosol aminopeptidase n=1 Tax=Hydrogenimonas cancrithermarum TaxID=2993563 RepID=A0ABM8FNM1_9BACT|nr:leucyl aminopeptidase [Hydrogenimonas cancrithermarum]BDY13951.1 putative cytosol aminopeptidase [Hydrogenimonas cancrithermarum]